MSTAAQEWAVWTDLSAMTQTWGPILVWARPMVLDVPRECGSTCSTGTGKAPPMGSSRPQMARPDHLLKEGGDRDTARSRAEVLAR